MWKYMLIKNSYKEANQFRIDFFQEGNKYITQTNTEIKHHTSIKKGFTYAIYTTLNDTTLHQINNQ